MSDDFKYPAPTITKYSCDYKPEDTARKVSVDDLLEEFRKKNADELNAKQLYADFAKAAMQGLLSSNQSWSIDYKFLANLACDAAEAALEEMRRRGK